MKESVLAIDCVIGIYALSWLNFVLIHLFLIGFLAAIATTVAAAFGLNKLRINLKEKHGLSTPRFFLFAYVPSIVLSMIFFMVKYHGSMTNSNSSTFFELMWFSTSAVEVAAGYVALTFSSRR